MIKYGNMEYTLLKFIIVIILMHVIAYYTVFIHAAPMEKNNPQSTRYFYAVSHRQYLTS